MNNDAEKSGARSRNEEPKGAFAAYLDLMLRLDALINQGLDEGPDGTVLREQMDAPWYAMTEVECDQIRAIGAALNAARDAARDAFRVEIAALNERLAAVEARIASSGEAR